MADSKLEAKIDKLDEKIDRIEVVLAMNTQILNEHQRRSTASEDRLELIEERFIEGLSTVKSQIDMVKAGAKVIVWLGVALTGLAGFVLTLRQLGVI